MIVMNNNIKKIDTNDLRINLSKYLTKYKIATIYITKYNKLVAELRVYTDETRAKAELRIAEKMIKNAEN